MRAVWVQVARGCARIDSRPDTAKIGSADRVEVHHARLLANIGVRKTFPHGLGQNRKSALVIARSALHPMTGHREPWPPCSESAMNSQGRTERGSQKKAALGRLLRKSMLGGFQPNSVS